MSKYLDYFNKKRIAIPGGGGFVGSHLKDILEKETDAELFIPRTCDGIDFRRFEDCQRFFAVTKPSIVINCAANQGGIAYHRGKQADLVWDNTLMNMFLMRAAMEAGVEKFVNLVPGCSYPGYLKNEEMNEEDFWNGKLHDSIFSYGFPRKASTVYGQALWKQYGFVSIHLVLANMYGPREHFNPDQSKALAGLMRKIYEAKLSGTPTVEVWGTGRPIRDWMYGKDGAEGVLRATSLHQSVDPLNIATGLGISIKDLAETIKMVSEYEGELIFDGTKPDGALHKTFGIHHMKEILNWVPTTSLEDGIRSTWEWLLKNYHPTMK